MSRTITMVVQDLAGLGSMRSRLSTMLLAHGVHDETAADVQVATTELVTNGLTHAGAPAVAVRASVDDRCIEMNVHHADGRQRRRPSRVVSGLDRGGRGLGIVGRMSDDMAVERTAGCRSTALVFERRRTRSGDAYSPLIRPVAGA